MIMMMQHKACALFTVLILGSGRCWPEALPDQQELRGTNYSIARKNSILGTDRSPTIINAAPCSPSSQA